MLPLLIRWVMASCCSASVWPMPPPLYARTYFPCPNLPRSVSVKLGNDRNSRNSHRGAPSVRRGCGPIRRTGGPSPTSRRLGASGVWFVDGGGAGPSRAGGGGLVPHLVGPRRERRRIGAVRRGAAGRAER